MSAPHCSGCHTDSTGIVLCCPLHAQADAAIDLLRRLVGEYDVSLDICSVCGYSEDAHSNEGGWSGHRFKMSAHAVNARIVELARPLIAEIDGAAPAESEA